MSVPADLVTGEREAIRQSADWYTQQGYQVSVEPAPRDLPEFLRTLAPDLVARRDGENIVVEIKTSSPASFEKISALRGPWNIVPAGSCKPYTSICPTSNGNRPHNCRRLLICWPG